MTDSPPRTTDHPHRPRSRSADPATAPVVLVAEDFDDVRELYAEILAEAGYRVIQAANGQEALSRIAETRPDLVVMDLTMPILDGWEATKLIKSNAATASIVVLAVTAHESFSLQDLDEYGVDALLRKPCLPDTLVRRVRELLEERG